MTRADLFTPDPVELMRLYVDDNDVGAFRELYAILAPRLRRHLHSMTKNAALTDDLLQLTFLKAHRDRHTWKRDHDPAPWLYTIARHTFLNTVRTEKRARVVMGDDMPEATADLTGVAVRPLVGGKRPKYKRAKHAPIGYHAIWRRQDKLRRRVEAERVAVDEWDEPTVIIPELAAIVEKARAL